MSQKDKLIERLLRKPKDFSFDDIASLLSYFGYTLNIDKLRKDGLL